MENHMLPLYRTLKNENAYNVKFVTFQDDHSFKKSRDKISEIIIDWVKN
jgi:dipeptidyl aminopeptidase/acylaminoacyl peptidase